MLVIGAPNSSNSVRLVEVAEREGARAILVQRGECIDFGWLEGVRTLGITAGASAPEVLVREVVDRLATRYAIREREVETVAENMIFKLPRGLAA
jgi:4-hydroxy-3-methylbut-2-enyl diphosphate reductase